MPYVLSALAAIFQTIPPAATAGVCALAALPQAEAALPMYLTLPLILEAAHYIFSSTSSRAFAGSVGPSKTLPEREASDMLELWHTCLADQTITTEDFISGWFAPVKGAVSDTWRNHKPSPI